jgi:hypothetical protein
MPYKIRKVKGKKCFSVVNTVTKRKHSKCTSKIRAKKQISLLHALDNPLFKQRKPKTKTRKHLK